MKYIIAAALILQAGLIAGCDKGTVTKHKRDQAYFSRFMNPSADYDKAEQKLGELKLLVSNEKYDMRYALFDNGKFYYEVDKLGKGTGKWSYHEGALNLFANRTFFDMDLNVLATEAQGDALAVQFIDRFGANTVKIQFRDPQSAKPLPHFSSQRRDSL